MEVTGLDFWEGTAGNGVNSCLIHLMHKYSSMNFKRFMELGVHPGQLPVMGILYTREGISLREMADLLHVKPPTVTVTVKRLEKAGLVCKKTDREDLRVSRIYMTEKGRSIVQEIRQQVAKDEKILTGGFSEDEIAQLQSFFKRMTDNLSRTEEGMEKGDCMAQCFLKQNGPEQCTDHELGA